MKLAYEPLITPLVKMIRRMREEAGPSSGISSHNNSNGSTPVLSHNHSLSNGASTGTGSLWVIVDGLEVVGEMSIEAFELMTGRKAPRNLMTRVCNETWERQSAPFQPQR